MAITLNDNILASAAKPLDALRGPYTGATEALAIAAANATVPGGSTGLRYIGRQVDLEINGVSSVYVWKAGIADTDLVQLTTPLPQPLGTTDSPTFANPLITGDIEVQGLSNISTVQVNSGSIGMIKSGIESFIGVATQTSSNTWLNPDKSGTYALTSDVSAAVAAGNHYRGKYATLSALTTAIPTGNDGDYAIVAGSASDQEYIWDSDNSAWALTTVVPAGTFAALGGAPSDNAALASALAAKVDAVSGYGLISDSDQTKLNGIENGATANSAAAQSDVTTGTDNVKYLTSALWTWIKTQAATISGLWNFTGGLQSGGNNVETQNNKDASSGYVGLTLFKINFKNALNNFTSYFSNNNTASRTYTFKDRSGTILDDTDAATFVDISSDQSAIGGDKTFTGNITISATSPTLKFITAGDGGLSFVNRTTTLNALTFSNNINSVGGFGNALLQTSAGMGITRSDVGMPTGTSIALTAMQWVKFTIAGVAAGEIISYGSSSTGLDIAVWTDGGVVVSNGSTVVFTLVTGLNLRDGNWHHVALKINGATCIAVIDGIAYTVPSVSAYNISLNGTLKTNGLSNNKAVIGYVDQLLIYSAFLATSDIQANYNGGTGTISVLTTNLIARYEFEGNLTDTNPNVTPVTATFLSSTGYAGVGNGKVPLAGSLQLNQQFLQYKDGINAGEYGQVWAGNPLSGTFLQGNSVYTFINGAYPFIQGNDGSILISKSNTIQTSRGLSALSVVDGLSVGTYATINAAPSNGLIVSGSVGIGTSSVLSKLNVAGGLSVGSTYAGTIAAPADGLIVQGKTGVGVTTTNSMFEVGGTTTSISGIGRGIYFSGTLRATASNDFLAKLDLTGGTSDIQTGATSLNITGGRFLTITTAGSGYTNGTYTAALTNVTGSGSGGIASIVISGGVVTSATITTAGSGYAIGNSLSVAAASVGGTGSGFTTVLTFGNLSFNGVIACDLKVGNGGILPPTSGGSFIGSTALPFNTVVANNFQGNSWVTLGNVAVSIVNASTGAYATWNASGNQVLNLGGAQTDNGYRLDVFTNASSPNGAIRTSGPLSAVSGVAHGAYINNTLNPIANNDVLVGLDIASTFGTNTTAIQTLGTITGGSGYSNITTQLRALTSGSGSGAAANFTIVGGIVTVVTIVNRGTGYTTSDVLSCTTIGPGTGFSIPVTSVGLTGVTNLSLRTSGDIQVGGKLSIPTGSNKSAGTATLVSGTVTINNTLVTANSIIMLSYRNPSGTTGTHLAQGIIVAGTSFVVNSLDTSSAIVTGDNNTFNWWIIN